MFRTTKTTIPLALILSAAAWAADPAKAPQQDQSRDVSAQPTAVAEDLARPAADREQAQQDPARMFISEAYNCNLFEIQLGQLAAERAQDNQVKQFARMMVDGHTKANQKLKQVAQSANAQVEEQLDPVHQAMLDKAQKCPAAEFGRKYINCQVGGHMATVLELRYQTQNAQNPQVKEYASKMLPKLEKHLQDANKIATQLAGGEAGTAAGRLPAGDAQQPQADRETAPGAASASDRTGASEKKGADQSSKADQSGQTGQSDSAGQDAASPK